MHRQEKAAAGGGSGPGHRQPGGDQIDRQAGQDDPRVLLENTNVKKGSALYQGLLFKPGRDQVGGQAGQDDDPRVLLENTNVKNGSSWVIVQARRPSGRRAGRSR